MTIDTIICLAIGITIGLSLAFFIIRNSEKYEKELINDVLEEKQSSAKVTHRRDAKRPLNGVSEQNTAIW